MADIEAFEKGKYFIYQEIDNYKNEFKNFNKTLKKKNKQMNEKCKLELEKKIKNNPNKFMKNMLETIKDNSSVIQKGGHTPKNISNKLDEIIKTQKTNQKNNTNFLEDIFNKLSNNTGSKNKIFTYIQVTILILIALLLLYIVYKLLIDGSKFEDILTEFKSVLGYTDAENLRAKLTKLETEKETLHNKSFNNLINNMNQQTLHQPNIVPTTIPQPIMTNPQSIMTNPQMSQIYQ